MVTTTPEMEAYFIMHDPMYQRGYEDGFIAAQRKAQIMFKNFMKLKPFYEVTGTQCLECGK